jgi:hypothetical protein
MATSGERTRSTSISSHNVGLSTPQDHLAEKPIALEKIPTTANFSKFHSVAVSGAIVATQFVQVCYCYDHLLQEEQTN